MIDLALAYNFATPYTAFLAIPASELDWQSAHALAGARAYKAELLKGNRLAGHDTAGRSTTGAVAEDATQVDSLISNSRAEAQPSPPRHERELAANDSAESEKSA